MAKTDKDTAPPPLKLRLPLPMTHQLIGTRELPEESLERFRQALQTGKPIRLKLKVGSLLLTDAKGPPTEGEEIDEGEFEPPDEGEEIPEEEEEEEVRGASAGRPRKLVGVTLQVFVTTLFRPKYAIAATPGKRRR
jgi:hypothetical protein